MTPHEVIKKSLEKFDKVDSEAYNRFSVTGIYESGTYKENIIDFQLSILLSVKEMVELRSGQEEFTIDDVLDL